MKAKNMEPLAHLVTRIPKKLHRRLKIHCVRKDLLLADFVLAAIQVKLYGNGADGDERATVMTPSES